MKRINNIFAAVVALGVFILASSCSDSKSYAELLTEENHYVNAFLADQRVEDVWPGEGKYEYGEDAPYYKMDIDGNVYMQVVEPGNQARAAKDNRVYFRFMRYNLSRYVSGGEMVGAGNSEDLLGENGVGSTYFLFENYNLQSSSVYGTGIQVPMNYLGSDAKVNIVIKSQYGWTSETANVIPFLYSVRYFESPMFPWTGEPAE